MCGIIYAKHFDGTPVNGYIMQQFEKQKSRGTEGFGIFDYATKHLIKNPKQKGIMRWLKKYQSQDLLFHHRFPTSTDNVKNACHPFSTKDHFDTNYVLVHNGHVSNSNTLRTAHEAMGIKYTSVQPDGSFNDSEALLWDVALYLEGKQTELKANGSIAFIVSATKDDNTVLHFARNSSPLNMLLTESQLYLSSEGEGISISSDKLYSFDYATKELTTKYLTVPSYPSYSSYGYDSYGSYDDYSYASKTSKGGIYGIRESLQPHLDNMQDILDDYLEQAEGTYADAYKMMVNDFNSFRDAYIEDMLTAGISDQDDLNYMDTLCGAITMLMNESKWISDHSYSHKHWQIANANVYLNDDDDEQALLDGRMNKLLNA